MPSSALVALLVSLLLCLVPVWLLRRRACTSAQDYFVSCEPTAPGIISNSSVAYALRLATFGPLFVWGASGDFWPALCACAALGLGIYFLKALARPMLEFVRRALAGDQSTTVHAFIAHRYGGDGRVRLLAASLTLFALGGLLACEAFGIAALLTPLFEGATHALLVGLALVLTALFVLPSGNAGVLRATQTQLGILYLALFGSTALLLYIVMATLRTMSPQDTLAVMVVALCCIVMLSYRRSRYVDTSAIDPARSASTEGTHRNRGPLSARLFTRIIKIINVCVSVLAVFVVVFAGMQLFFQGAPFFASDRAAPLQIGTPTSTLAFIALAALLLFYPVVDVSNWQRIAALAKASDGSRAAPDALAVGFGTVVRIYAIETAIVSLFFCMFGALAVAALRTPGGVHVLEDVLQQLSSQDNWVAAGASTLFVLAIGMIALSTMSALFSASLYVVRFDIVPAIRPDPARADTAREARARTLTILAGIGLCVVVGGATLLAQPKWGIDFPGNRFLALVFAFCCAQLSFAPLILGAVIGSKASDIGREGPGWALAIMGFAAAAGIGVAAAYLVSGNEPLLWLAAPACLATGFVMLAIARLRSPKAS